MERILITGAGGLVGRALVKLMTERGEDTVALMSRDQCDLTSQSDVFALFREVKPTAVFHLAAAVYGVGGNIAFPADVSYRNSIMNALVLEAAKCVGVRKIIAMGSAAIYSDGLGQPMQERDGMAGEPHDSEYAYAFSKRAMLAQLQAYQKQWGIDFGFAIATNMYGPYDRFDTQYGHVVPSLLKKFLDAETSGAAVEIWGDGTPTRDFLYVADAAEGLRLMMEKGRGAYNVATGRSVSISALVTEIARQFPKVEYFWNTDKPLGQLTRSYDISRMRELGFSPRYDICDGIAATVAWLRQHVGDIRG